MIDGCFTVNKKVFSDKRGYLFEGFRNEELPLPVGQLTVFKCNARAIKGMRVHIVRHDYFIPVVGKVFIGLVDLRKSSPTFGQSETVIIDGDDPRALYVPPGVGHGLAFPEEAVYLNSFLPYWQESDEVAFRYDDPQIKITWPVMEPIISDKDRAGMSLIEAINAYESKSETTHTARTL